ncbi:class I adenylate-forming enzyme family protein [Rhodococcus opacus]|uniref:class I adenylate-forming enzyme family protein n=1 Tax=Rhodococcus opacus TaxID=37919 RepID=UPI00155A707A|nr:class I adenylate-forming enzyme family protein [Rhodococcus opacus]
MTSDELLNGLPRSLSYPQVGMDSMLAGVAASYGNRIALMDGDDHLTFGELHDDALRIATWLRRRGVDHGDRVAIAMPNNIWFAGVYLGTVLAGATACVVNPLTPPATLAEQFEDFDPVALFIHPTSESALEARTSRMELVVRAPGTHTSGRGAAGRPDSAVPLVDLLAVQPQPLPACHPDTVAHLQLTGGTLLPNHACCDDRWNPPPTPGHNHAHRRTRRSRNDGDEARSDPRGRSHRASLRP